MAEFDTKWGPGIPTYKNTDLLSKKDLYGMAVNATANYLVSQKHTIVDINKDMNGSSSIVCKINNRLSFVLVQADIAPNFPSLNNFRKAMLINEANNFNADTYFVSIAFGSKDKERLINRLALKDDQFMVKSKGLDKIELKDDINDSLWHLYYLLLSFPKAIDTFNLDLYNKEMTSGCSFSYYKKEHTSNNKIDALYELSSYIQEIKRNKESCRYLISLYDSNSTRRFKNKESNKEITILQIDNHPVLFIGKEGELFGRYADVLDITLDEEKHIKSVNIYPYPSMKLKFDENKEKLDA